MSELENSPAAAAVRPYFAPMWGNGWNWGDAGNVIEWSGIHEGTICYRAELANLLRGLQEQGLPPLAPLLLLLAACADIWPTNGDGIVPIMAMPKRMLDTVDDPDPAQLEWKLRHVSMFLDVVRGLPEKLRTGAPKLHLLRSIFGVQAPRITPDQAPAVLDEWESGRHEEWRSIHMGRYTRRELYQDTSCLADALNRFPDSEQLAQHLRTGLTQVVSPLLGLLNQLALPPTPAPAEPTEPLDLLDQLGEDPRTAGLARLTRQLLAVLRVPLHTHGASEQPLGGVADLSNRGSFDRLLISELAHDNDTLLARLVNNEALYLRREAPPQPDQPPRTILLDTTLRLWGVPRVFALAAALAWARQPRPGPAATAYALGGQQVTALDLSSFKGVVEAMSCLDPALHCGPALLAAGAQVAATDCLLITAAELLPQPAFRQHLTEAAPRLRYLLTVDRSGELELYEWTNGHRQLLGSAQYDLDELLFPPQATRAPSRPTVAADAPAYVQLRPAPLYFPVVTTRITTDNTLYAASNGVLYVTDSQRVLYWPNPQHAALELLPLIERGLYCFGLGGAGDDYQEHYIMVSGTGRLLVYWLETKNRSVTVVIADLSAELTDGAAPKQVDFKDHRFLVRLPDRMLVFNCRRFEVEEPARVAIHMTAVASRYSLSHVKKLINNGYSTIQRVSRLGISDAGELVIDKHHLRLVAHAGTLRHDLQLVYQAPEPGSPPRRIQAKSTEPVALTENPQVLFRRFDWPDGSVALVDSRGLLHLRSADAAIPEFTLLLVAGQPTAGWSADGSVCGPDYFVADRQSPRLSASVFIEKYLQPFIAHLG